MAAGPRDPLVVKSQLPVDPMPPLPNPKAPRFPDPLSPSTTPMLLSPPSLQLQPQTEMPVLSKEQSTPPPCRKKKKKKKKRKKGQPTIGFDKQRDDSRAFLSKYSASSQWTRDNELCAGRTSGQPDWWYTLQFAEREPIRAPLSFHYSWTLYLTQTVGINKSYISSSFVSFMLLRAVH